MNQQWIWSGAIGMLSFVTNSKPPKKSEGRPEGAERVAVVPMALPAQLLIACEGGAVTWVYLLLRRISAAPSDNQSCRKASGLQVCNH